MNMISWKKLVLTNEYAIDFDLMSDPLARWLEFGAIRWKNTLWCSLGLSINALYWQVVKILNFENALNNNKSLDPLREKNTVVSATQA